MFILWVNLPIPSEWDLRATLLGRTQASQHPARHLRVLSENRMRWLKKEGSYSGRKCVRAHMVLQARIVLLFSQCDGRLQSRGAPCGRGTRQQSHAQQNRTDTRQRRLME